MGDRRKSAAPGSVWVAEAMAAVGWILRARMQPRPPPDAAGETGGPAAGDDGAGAPAAAGPAGGVAGAGAGPRRWTRSARACWRSSRTSPSASTRKTATWRWTTGRTAGSGRAAGATDAIDGKAELARRRAGSGAVGDVGARTRERAKSRRPREWAVTPESATLVRHAKRTSRGGIAETRDNERTREGPVSTGSAHTGSRRIECPNGLSDHRCGPKLVWMFGSNWRKDAQHLHQSGAEKRRHRAGRPKRAPGRATPTHGPPPPDRPLDRPAARLPTQPPDRPPNQSRNRPPEGPVDRLKTHLSTTSPMRRTTRLTTRSNARGPPNRGALARPPLRGSDCPTSPDRPTTPSTAGPSARPSDWPPADRPTKPPDRLTAQQTALQTARPLAPAGAAPQHEDLRNIRAVDGG